MGSLFLVGGLFVLAGAALYHQLAVRPLPVDSPRHRSRRRLQLIILAIGALAVAYGVWQMRVPGPSA